jgi:hypothetical protein
MMKYCPVHGFVDVRKKDKKCYICGHILLELKGGKE